ncbi:MAG: Hsp70 family protein [Vulcanimicrobiota bacterium]
MTWVIGIDLGTTNTTLAYAEPAEEEGEEYTQEVFEIPQLVAPNTVEGRTSLPSFLYLPSEHEVGAGSLSLPWDEVALHAVGTYARDEGVKVPDHLISSAKSWLSQEGVDRKGKILPWKAPEDVEQQSPVEASTNYLRHLADSWKWKHKDAPLPDQEVVLTVPASFDAVARELTAEAARAAGLANITLLEEPQAAFYAWLDKAGEDWRSQVGKGDLVLVCDIGGGTTDLSLIKVYEEEGDLALERVAVGEHILLGGDNMDLTLAVSVRARLKKEGTKLDSWQFQVLTHGCRAAKEALLGGSDEDTFQVTIPGRGSKLIGGALQVDIERDEVEKLLMEGFFPEVEADERPAQKTRVGLTELGLPYEADPAITRHLAGFLKEEYEPTAILFNGGVFKATQLRDRLVDVVNSWVEEPVKVLEGTDLDLAVARGAVRYGLVKKGHGIRIRGGLSRSYYIGVEVAMPAVPGMEPPIKAVCVAPKGMEEGSELDVPDQEFGLVLGEDVEFPFLASSEADEVGTVHEDWEDEEIEELAKVGATLKGDGGVVPVRLQTVATEIGTLELYCVERDGEGRWKLEFEVRESE